MISKQDFPSINDKAPTGLKPDGTPYKILVVDDSIFVTKQLNQILTSEGYEVVATALDGLEAIEKYKELCPKSRLGNHGYHYAKDGRVNRTQQNC